MKNIDFIKEKPIPKGLLLRLNELIDSKIIGRIVKNNERSTKTNEPEQYDKHLIADISFR